MWPISGLVALLSTLLSVTALTSLQDADTPRATLDAGPIVGVPSGPINVFKGIPYAKPPVGRLRWRAPQLPDHWTAARPASTFGAACPQTSPVDLVDGGAAAIEEDCLTLNVWAPSHASSPAPVMVWLHGGGNTQGAGSKRYYDGSAFALDGIVVVTINYRLGPLGFFAHPALTKETPRTEPLANFALMDQLAALRWVKTNIHAFGGDASNVTIFGESAGGVDILTLLTIPDATGLFQKAIVESAGFVAHSVALEAAERQGVAIAQAAGAKNASAQQLRALTTSALINAKVESDGPIVDGRLLKDRPVSQFATGRFLHVPLMIGTNSDEGSLIEGATPSDVLGTFTASEIDSLRNAYGGLNDAALARAVFRDHNFASPSRWIAARSAAAAPTYLYRFSYLRRSQRGRVPGASHGAEIPYVFDSWKQSPSGGSLLPAEDRTEAARLHACWVVFAKTGSRRDRTCRCGLGTTLRAMN